MKFGHIFTLLAVCCFSTAIFSGCEAGSATTETSEHDHDDGHDHDGHDHDGHDHDGHEHAKGDLPAHGPKGGHLFRLSGTENVGEWLHYNDSDIIRVYLLDLKNKNAVPCDGITITPKAGDDKTPFVLELDEEASGADQKLVYMLDEKALQLAMNLGVEVEFTVGDKKFKGAIAPHAPHDH